MTLKRKIKFILESKMRGVSFKTISIRIKFIEDMEKKTEKVIKDFNLKSDYFSK